jgi:hypothetical protein
MVQSEQDVKRRAWVRQVLAALSLWQMCYDSLGRGRAQAFTEGGAAMRMQSASSRWLVGVAVVVTALVVVSVVAAVLGRSEVALLPEDTPEGTVQRFLQAMEEGDPRAAYSYLSADLQQRCTYQGFRDSTLRFDREDRRITLEGTEPLDGGVEVEVRITTYRVDPPFGARESSFTARYTLEKEGGAWRFTDPPWPQSWCPEPAEQSKPSPVPSPS